MFQIIKKQKGFALPSAIFLMVSLSTLAIAMFALNAYNQKSSIIEVLDTKAYVSAKAGAEYGVYQAVKNSSCSLTSQTVSLTDPYLAGFKFSYICEATTDNEAGVSETYYRIISYGCNTSGASCPDAAGRPTVEDYVEKSIIMIASKN